MAARTRYRMAVLALLYASASAAGVLGVVGIFRGGYWQWALGLFACVTLLLSAYWIRSGKKPWQREQN